MMLSAALLVVSALPAARAWGAAGHQVSAAVCERHLTPAAAAGVAADLQTFGSLYPSESELITSSTWADTIKSSNGAFNEWHYTDTIYAPSGGEYDLCEPQNVNWAMHQCVSVLSKAKADLGNRALMARLLVHFIGDIHQPLHASSLFSPAFPGGDGGGNFIKLSPPAKVGSYSSSNLHSFWDAGGPSSGLEDITKGDVEGARLMAEVLDDEEAAKIAATPLASVAAIGQLLDSMVAESYAYAINTTYAAALLTALGSGQTVDTTLPMWAAYAEATSQVSKQRLKLAGARMAQVLNSLYNSDSSMAKLAYS